MRALLSLPAISMRRRFIPLILSTVSMGAAFLPARGAAAPVPGTGGFVASASARPSESNEEETRTLRQSLFKKPLLRAFDPGPSLTVRPPVRTPVAPPPPRPLVIVPPPAPREISNAERELSLQPAEYTPYDRYSGPVRLVIARVDRRAATMARARTLMNEAHAFRYRSADPYRAAMPEMTATARAGDCKAKSLWLYDQLGDGSALYVIGKTFKGAVSNHAWIYWRCDSQWWILDPTNRSAPLLAENIPSDRYVPYYSFGKDGTFRHRATWLFMAGAPPVAAPGGKPRVARR